MLLRRTFKNKRVNQKITITKWWIERWKYKNERLVKVRERAVNSVERKIGNNKKLNIK